ncbi:GmrSD restriction endonuclease domain-containing protein [Mucilaginibacter sp.]
MSQTELETLDIENEDEQDSDVLIEYDIASYPSDYTLSVLYKMWQDGDIDIPDFQRGFVWTIHQSSLLIESFLIGLPVPPIFLYIDKENTNLVVDGQQRLLSVVFFMEGYFGGENEKGKRQTFRLTGLNEKNPYYNKRFADLISSDQKKLENSVLRAINIRQLTPSPGITSIYHIFERLNTGGTPLTPQEIRNVVYRGELFLRLKTLNKDENWRKILGKKTLDKHQKDVELVLRALALSHYLNEYEKPMKEFLNKIAGRNKKADSKQVKTFIEEFPKACNIIVSTIGVKPFHVRGPLNTSAFDSIFCTILNHTNKIPKDLKARYDALVASEKFIELTSLATTDTKIVQERFSLVKKTLID